ncbi:54S ribosomal protein L6 [Botrytis cinerea]
MLSTARSKGISQVLTSAPSVSIPSFLLPAFPIASRSFSASTCRNSHIGSAVLSIPPEVTFKVIPPPPPARGSAVAGRPVVKIEGPLGKMSMSIEPFIKIEHDENTRKATVRVEDREVKNQRAMWGTTRAYLQNHILGVSEGHNAILRLVGVGYRQQFVVLKVGYSHPIELPVPRFVKASTPQPTRILLEGPEKEVVLLFAAQIRKWRVPEPYKGKGIFVNGEEIKLKNKKIK